MKIHLLLAIVGLMLPGPAPANDDITKVLMLDADPVYRKYNF